MSSSASAIEMPRHRRCPRKRRWWTLSFRRRIQLWGFGFVLPTLLFLAVFKYGPMIWAINLSFEAYDIVSPPRYVGLDNYHALLSDPIFRETLLNTIYYVLGSTVLTTVVGLALALAINTGIPGARTCMTAMFLTNLMPIIAVCLVWRFLLHPYGLVNQVLEPLGIGRINWLTGEWTAMPAVIIVTVWRFAPYFTVVFLAALLARPADYFEAAEMEGAGPLRRFWHVTLPLLSPTIFFVVVVSALLSARIFLMPYIITGGGPGNATRVLSMLIYETAFSYMRMGQARPSRSSCSPSCCCSRCSRCASSCAASASTHERARHRTTGPQRPAESPEPTESGEAGPPVRAIERVEPAAPFAGSHQACDRADSARLPDVLCRPADPVDADDFLPGGRQDVPVLDGMDPVGAASGELSERALARGLSDLLPQQRHRLSGNPSVEGMRNAAAVLHRLRALPAPVAPEEVVDLQPVAELEQAGYFSRLMGVHGGR